MSAELGLEVVGLVLTTVGLFAAGAWTVAMAVFARKAVMAEMKSELLTKMGGMETKMHEELARIEQSQSNTTDMLAILREGQIEIRTEMRDLASRGREYVWNVVPKKKEE